MKGANRKTLEARVQRRTLELSKLNGELMVEINQRKQMEAALALARERFQSLMGFMPDASYFKDRQSRFVLVNRAFAQSLGFSSPAE